MPPTTVQLEAHPLDVLDGIHCPTCRTDTVTHVRVAIVASDSLRVLGHVDAEACASCDRLEVTR